MGYTCTRRSKYFWKNDRSVQVWDLRHVDLRGSAVFHLPYETGQPKRAILPQEAMLMFTSEMTGCTFGMAIHRDDTVEICHANHQTKSGQRETVRGKAEPDLMRQARLGATMVGVRSLESGWTIYAQQWENLDGTNFKYRDLIKL